MGIPTRCAGWRASSGVEQGSSLRRLGMWGASQLVGRGPLALIPVPSLAPPPMRRAPVGAARHMADAIVTCGDEAIFVADVLGFAEGEVPTIESGPDALGAPTLCPCGPTLVVIAPLPTVPVMIVDPVISPDGRAHAAVALLRQEGANVVGVLGASRRGYGDPPRVVRGAVFDLDRLDAFDG